MNDMGRSGFRPDDKSGGDFDGCAEEGWDVVCMMLVNFYETSIVCSNIGSV